MKKNTKKIIGITAGFIALSAGVYYFLFGKKDKTANRKVTGNKNEMEISDEARKFISKNQI